MWRDRKPIRSCYTCLLNQGDHCWGYRCPREQWGHRSRCPAFESPAAYQLFAQWKSQAHVKTRKELRQGAFPKRRVAPRHFLEDVPERRAL